MGGTGMAYSEQDSHTLSQGDIFDNPPDGPVGVHRGNMTMLRRSVPYFVVLIVAVLAGLLVWGYYSGELSKTLGIKPETSAQTVSQPKADKKQHSEKKKKKTDKKDKDATAGSNTGSNQAPQQAPAPVVNKQIDVQIVNGSGITGYAAQKKSVLNQAGYATVTASNPSGQVPDESVVWYADEADKATAQDIANTLGVGKVQQQSGIAHAVVVVLKN
jgi:cytoskeletal protein RodZ